jgi:DUF1680 family protein
MDKMAKRMATRKLTVRMTVTEMMMKYSIPGSKRLIIENRMYLYVVTLTNVGNNVISWRWGHVVCCQLTAKIEYLSALP